MLGKSAAETVLMLEEAFKEKSLSKTQVYECESLYVDQPRTGRPSACWNDENLEKDRNAIGADLLRTYVHKFCAERGEYHLRMGTVQTFPYCLSIPLSPRTVFNEL